VVAERVLGARARPGAILPFGFGREPDHLVLANQTRCAQLLGHSPAELLGFVKRHHFDRVAWALPAARVRPHHGFVEVLRHLVFRDGKRPRKADSPYRDRKSTRLNSSHVKISYAVFCLKKKTKNNTTDNM